MEPGQGVVTLLAAANRDPARFPDPDRVDIRRPDIQHLTFSHGIHYCLGAALAMAEQRVVLDAVTRRADMHAPDPRPERARNRNVTMIPAHGARVVVSARRPV